MTPFVVIVLAGLGSYLFRISMVLLAERMRLPERLERASSFVAPAAFAALAATSIAAASMGADVAAAVPPLGASAVAVAAVRLFRRAWAAPLVGMPVLWLLTAVVGS
ncbi:AzlD domain-containing protein [Isoptericola croceus]|uniref:AzlD domain-containing protein n=1 Tax=Isoptericola croceus TaxID=3031406 RepID=UPI0023F9EB9C|nr:AzlD domain-containing protein [Isoptericola croceus]